MEELLSGGKIGEMFTALAFSGALVATISYFLAEFATAGEKKSWEKISNVSFSLHAVSVLGIISTLFYLIYSHQYQYHYVWSHSSNELPVYYMISCFWEGQEGSFLLWTFWHAILGVILMIRKDKWRNLVLGVIASVQVILTSMVLGTFVNEGVVVVLLILLCLIPVVYFWNRMYSWKAAQQDPGIFPALSMVIALLGMGLILAHQTGFYASWSLKTAFSNTDSILFTVIIFFLVFYACFLIVNYFGGVRIQDNLKSHPASGILRFFVGSSGGVLNGMDLFFATVALLLPWVMIYITPEFWKIGSSPFILLRDAMSDAPIFAMNPDFVPKNGTGLNPLLQNYWMVIHPPTLFLGFASTVVPFAFVIAALIKQDYTDWIRPAAPWTIFSVMILGVGIIMGGYWAYETLNFGGYWNWDPVENASFVPWLIGIGSLHGMLAFKRSKTFLKLTMLLVIFTFLLILYSTFLTRSGILGNTSVHSFTDLGLSGQLLVLLVFYFVTVFILVRVRWIQIPEQEKEIHFLSPEFFLFLATLIFIFSSLGITISTSLPVINKIFGSNLAAPPQIQFFYYRWNVWFAILFGAFAGIGQYLYWRKYNKEEILKAMFRPFLAAVVAASLVVILLAYSGWQFAFEGYYDEWLEMADLTDSPLKKIAGYLKYGLYTFTDEFMLLSALFVIAANVDIMVSLIRKNDAKLRVMGGTFAHIGFGMMLIGMLFSSGYDSIVSKNVNPGELTNFDPEAQQDNVLLLKDRPRIIYGYEVTYKGKKNAIPPVSDIKVIEKEMGTFKIRFRDAENETFGMSLPNQGFVMITDGGSEIDVEEVEKFLNENVKFMKPGLINNRSLYGLKFMKINSLESSYELDSASAFVLYPEAEVNEGMGLVAHPARKIFAEKDLYVHVSSIPTNEDFVPQFKNFNYELGVGDTITTSEYTVFLRKINNLGKSDEYDIQVEAELVVRMKDQEVDHVGRPQYRVASSGEIFPKNDYVDDIHTLFYFVDIDPKKGKMRFESQVQITFENDYIVLKAIHKPYINFLWLGTFILVFGFILAIYRRVKENS